MEAYFDNHGDVLNARIRVPRDDSVIYTVKTTFGLSGRKITVLRDENPPPPSWLPRGPISAGTVVTYPSSAATTPEPSRTSSASSRSAAAVAANITGAAACLTADDWYWLQRHRRRDQYHHRQSESSTIVGIINWKDKTIDVCGRGAPARRRVADVKRVERRNGNASSTAPATASAAGSFRRFGLFSLPLAFHGFGFGKAKHLWRWGPDSKRRYSLEHHKDGWKAIIASTVSPDSRSDDRSGSLAAHFQVPLRPQLFRRPDPPTLHLSRTALEEDEVFLILAFIYEEVKRQDRTNSSSANGNVGW